MWLVLSFVAAGLGWAAAAGAAELREGPQVSSAAELEAAVTESFAAAFPARTPQWRFARPHPFASGAEGPLRLAIPVTLKGGKNWFQLRADGPKPRAYLLPVDLEWADSVWVATMPFRAGHQLAPTDVDRRWMNHTHSPQAIALPSSPVGLCVKQAVRGGEILTADNMREPYLIERGTTVRLRYQSGGLTIAARAEALENGTLGEEIRVRPLDGRTVCKGTICGEKEVEVILP